MNQLLRASLAASTIVAAATAQDYWAGGSPWSRPWQLWGLEQQLFTSSNNQAAFFDRTRDAFSFVLQRSSID